MVSSEIVPECAGPRKAAPHPSLSGSDVNGGEGSFSQLIASYYRSQEWKALRSDAKGLSRRVGAFPREAWAQACPRPSEKSHS